MKENDANPNRRRFIKGAAAAGLLGALNSSPATNESAQAAPLADEPQTSPALGPTGLLDQRYPVSYQTSIPAAVKVITDYFAALSQRDLKGMAELCHFPFATFEGTTIVVVNSMDELLSSSPPASMNTAVTGERWANHGSYMASRCYDIFGGLEILNSNPVCANLSLVYNRYNAAGHITLQCQGIYVVTNNDGKWGIELMSTIFTPGDLIGKVYNETIEAGLRGRITHDIGPNTNDSDADLYDYQYGRNATVSVGGGGFFGVRGANEDPMASFRTEGVKSRLRVREVKAGSPSPDASLNVEQSGGKADNPADVEKYKDDWSWYRAMFKRTGLGEVGLVFGILPYSRVIHAGVDKAHVFTGITRYTPAGEAINSEAEIDVVTWKKGRWGVASTGARVMMQDRANDRPRSGT